MHLEKRFEVACPREHAAGIIGEEDTLVGLFADSKTEVVAREGSVITTRTHYRALGKDGVATFRFTRLDGGNLEFEKVCDGRVWRQLSGKVNLVERGDGTSVSIEMDGKTKGFVPEFTIRLPMQEQLDQMESALRARIEASASR